jgi:hypothetical protein
MPTRSSLVSVLPSLSNRERNDVSRCPACALSDQPLPFFVHRVGRRLTVPLSSKEPLVRDRKVVYPPDLVRPRPARSHVFGCRAVRTCRPAGQPLVGRYSRRLHTCVLSHLRVLCACVEPFVPCMCVERRECTVDVSSWIACRGVWDARVKR